MVMVISTMIFLASRFSSEKFQICCDEVNSQEEKKGNVPKQ